MANSLKLRCLCATWQKIGLNLSPLYNSDIIGAVALFGGLGVTWRDSVVTAKSPQLACHLPDAYPGLDARTRLPLRLLQVYASLLSVPRTISARPAWISETIYETGGNVCF